MFFLSQNDIQSRLTKNKKGKNFLNNRALMKTPPTRTQITQEKEKKLDKNMKKATSGRFIKFTESSQSIEDLDNFFLSFLVDPEENNGDNNDAYKGIGSLEKLVAKISYPKFVCDNVNDKVTNNRHGKDSDRNIFRRTKLTWNKNKGIELV